MFSGKQFDVDDAILNALAGLEVNLGIQSNVKLDDCAFTIRLWKAYCLLDMINISPDSVKFQPKRCTCYSQHFDRQVDQEG